MSIGYVIGLLIGSILGPILGLYIYSKYEKRKERKRVENDLGPFSIRPKSFKKN